MNEHLPTTLVYSGARRGPGYTPFDSYTTWLPDQVFRAFTDAVNAAPKDWPDSAIAWLSDPIEDSIYDTIAGRIA